MCLLFVDVNRFPSIPLIVTFNRDESHDRPAAPAAFWSDEPKILAGRDLLKGGTWGGITTTGRMAFITFVRRKEPFQEFPRPRGEIVPAFLRGSQHALDFLNELHRTRSEYLGYNIVCGTSSELFHYSNAEGRISRIADGVHGVSNALFNTPWPKVVRGVERIRQLDLQQVCDNQTLLEIAMDDKRADAEQVPKDTGMSYEKEWYRSSIFVQAPGYGTRSTTVIVFHASGDVQFTERTHYPGNGDQSFFIRRTIES